MIGFPLWVAFSVIRFLPFKAFDHFAVVPRFGPQFVIVNPAVPAETVAVLVVVVAALAQFRTVEPYLLFHYQFSSFYEFPRRTSTNTLDKSMLARFAVAQY